MLSAKYGATIKFANNGPKGPEDNYVDVTSIVGQKIAEGTTRLKVCNEYFGDPVYGVVKQLVITYSDETVRVFREGEMANLVNAQLLDVFTEHRSYEDLLTDKVGVEIGGPSHEFHDLGVYKYPKSLDNVNYSAETIWSKHTELAPYEFDHKTVPGVTYIADVVDLSIFEDSKYDFTFSSHVLEHLVNPLKAMAELYRVTKPGGFTIAVLPWKEGTFDHQREITEFSELLEHFEENRGEDDVLDHLDAILPKYDLSRDPQAGTMEQFIARCFKHGENRALHVHVFDFDLVIKCLEFTGYTVIDKQMWRPYHQIVVAKKP